MRLLVHAGLDVGAHGDAFAKVRAAIERDDLRSADVKKLSSASGLYRAKLDAKNRVILTFIRAKDETVCLALEVVDNHAYDRSRFLRGAPIDTAAIESAPVCDAPDATRVPFIHAARPTFHFLDRPLSFDDAQEAVYRARPRR